MHLTNVRSGANGVLTLVKDAQMPIHARHITDVIRLVTYCFGNQCPCDQGTGRKLS